MNLSLLKRIIGLLTRRLMPMAAAALTLTGMIALACDECKTVRLRASENSGGFGCPIERPLSAPTLAVENTNSDTTAPVLVHIDFTPKTVDVSQQSADVTFTAHITDDKSGVIYVV